MFTREPARTQGRLSSRVPDELEDLSHDPMVGIRIDWTRVYVDMHTPDEGGITEADIELVKQFDDAARGSEFLLSGFDG